MSARGGSARGGRAVGQSAVGQSAAEEHFRRKAGAPPRILGHRGVRALEPENTLPAFEEAARQGADGIELDVRLCGSGEVVVLHDPDLSRVTHGGDRRAAAALSYRELCRVDLGGGARAPLLSEVLAFARGRGLAVNVEVKRDVPDRLALVRAMARLLRTWDPRHALLISSFDPAMLAALGALLPATPRALLVARGHHHEGVLRLAGALGVLAVHLDRTLTTSARVSVLQRRGVMVNVWTVNDMAEACSLAALGVDGLITDAPRQIREAVEASPRGGA
ncbi:glycerophosphodiester phosphodiesterase [Chondromyces apiculatus]|uniref:Glycerophosphoryl diester phosphodiesterase n=1 Tax=Chondromyces apiculatus DSM 436 TaxID=1192034 RepID=A0A017SU71_9BACT|nr:glycerophosphodiester phosphodiesterase family protein [Chondromyces apiculatus]EYF00140.1 Glycerophosphoryl diester phosphodiesterase [Chondromyces apiculatus DSM 436]